MANDRGALGCSAKSPGSVPTEPDSAEEDSGRATFGWFLLLFFLLNVGQGVFAPLLPQIMDGLGLSFVSAGILGASLGVARFVVDLPAGILAERLNIPRILHIAMALQLVGTGLSALATSLAAMLLARGLIGLGSGMSMVVAILYLMRRSPAERRMRWANVYEVAVIGGMSISSELAGMVAAWRGWRWSFALAAGVLGLAWLVAALRVAPGIRHLLDDGDPPAPASSQGVRRLDAGILAVYFAIFAQAFTWGGAISTLLPLYGGRALMLSPEVIGRTMAIAFAVEVCLLFPVGWASDVLGKVRVMIPGFLAMLVGTVVAPATRGGLGYGVAYSLVVAGMAVWMVPPALLSERLPSGFSGRVAGFYRLVIDVGIIVGPALIGLAIEWWGFQMAAGAVAAVLVSSICLSGTLIRGVVGQGDRIR